MKQRRSVLYLLLAALFLVACRAGPETLTATPALPTAMPTAVPETATPTAAAPTATATVAVPTATATTAAAATATTAATATATTAATATATPVPTATPPSQGDGLDPDVMALYGAGVGKNVLLYLLRQDGATQQIEPVAYRDAAVSVFGRWLATPNNVPGAAAVVVTSLVDELTYTIPTTEGWGVYGMAFDPAGFRLAFVELASADIENIPWAIVVLNLEDGSTVRFEGITDYANNDLPARPLGWISGGRELVMNHFLPYSDGLYAGIWAVNIPPDAKAGPILDLERRELIPGGAYHSLPDISPDLRTLLYLTRDWDYMPDDYEPGMDMGVNQLWSLDVETLEATKLYEVTDGSLLGGDAAWSPDGTQALFAQGRYAGMYWDELALYTLDQEGNVKEAAPIELENGTWLSEIAWCRPAQGIVTFALGSNVQKLHTVDLEEGTLDQIASAEMVFLVGCVHK